MLWSESFSLLQKSGAENWKYKCHKTIQVRRTAIPRIFSSCFFSLFLNFSHILFNFSSLKTTCTECPRLYKIGRQTLGRGKALYRLLRVLCGHNRFKLFSECTSLHIGGLTVSNSLSSEHHLIIATCRASLKVTIIIRSAFLFNWPFVRIYQRNHILK